MTGSKRQTPTYDAYSCLKEQISFRPLVTLIAGSEADCLIGGGSAAAAGAGAGAQES